VWVRLVIWPSVGRGSVERWVSGTRRYRSEELEPFELAARGEVVPSGRRAGPRSVSGGGSGSRAGRADRKEQRPAHPLLKASLAADVAESPKGGSGGRSRVDVAVGRPRLGEGGGSYTPAEPQARALASIGSPARAEGVSSRWRARPRSGAHPRAEASRRVCGRKAAPTRTEAAPGSEGAASTTQEGGGLGSSRGWSAGRASPGLVRRRGRGRAWNERCSGHRRAGREAAKGWAARSPA
jgi:hypothetical protein